MDNKLIEAARSEQAALSQKRTELEEKLDAIDRRISELETFVRVAGTIAVSSDVFQPNTAASAISLDLIPQTPSAGTKPVTFKDRVIALTEELLTRQKWMKTKDIVERLEASGVAINTSANKVVRVSSILVKEKDKFSSSRKKGWTLRQARIDAPKVKGPNARTFSPLSATSRGGQPTLAALPSD